MTARPDDDTQSVSTLSFMLTYRCTISCSHCMVEAGPRRKEKMALGSAFGWLDETASWREGRIKAVNMTGGEPFYDQRTLALVSDHACRGGISVSAETNASWAGSLGEAIVTLNQLPSISSITIGTDYYHQQFIPITNIQNAIIAAELLGRRYQVAVTTDNLLDERYISLIRHLKRIIDPRLIRSEVTVPAGRARTLADSLRTRTAPEPVASACAAAVTPVILPDGRVMACTEPMRSKLKSCPLCLGDLRKEPLEAILDRAETNPLLQLIRICGPHRMISLLESRGYGDILPKEYICDSRCDICHKILSDKRLATLVAQIVEEPETRAVVASSIKPRSNDPDMAKQRRLDGSGHIDKANTAFLPDA